MGRTQAVQPLLREECVRPTLVVATACASASVTALTQDAPEATPEPFVQRTEDRPVTMPEVAKPPPRNVALTSTMMASRLRPFARLVFGRNVCFNFRKLFGRGSRMRPFLNQYPRN